MSYEKTDRIYEPCEGSPARGQQKFHQTVYRCVECGAAVCVHHQQQHQCKGGRDV